ncbi:Uu.00g110010.m01.CDS01 [Anthostomella pinea]|uniref:Uu.00g110010.m01.CDS01 n=1 Tax=Anthostomella pinea TaxID=933095 RepID=A0AAI8VEQ5_9PEZI|nr:Uu.00g110010.m01.CDS01 [Anthostomella pinea]
MRGTIDNLTCIMLEGEYKINCGNPRRAWADYRRAITVAHLTGFHRSPMPQLKRINPGLDENPAFVWFRINYMNRYLRLSLGLPPLLPAERKRPPSHAHDSGDLERADWDDLLHTPAPGD